MSPPTWFRLLGLATLLIVLGFAVPAWTDDAAKGMSYALLIGVKDYTRATLGELKYTENDVEELAKVLDKPGSPFYKNVRLLTCSRGKKNKDDTPTAANIVKALAALVKSKGKDDTVLVALAGHGIQLNVRDPKNKGKDKGFAYFCPQDADLPGADYETGRHEHLVLLSDLLGDLGDCGAGTKLLLMDACRNERTARSLRLNKELVPDGVAALFSCKTGQFAFETAKLGKGHGVFFHHVIEALKGEAKDRRGRVTWGRLVEHVTDSVVADVPRLIEGSASQTPHEIKNVAGSSPVLVSGLTVAEAGDKDRPKKDKAGQEEVVKGPLDKDENSVGMAFVRVKKGSFKMGSTEQERKDVYEMIKPKNKDGMPDWIKAEGPQHEVELTQDFYLGVYEVTQKQFKEVMGYNPSSFSSNGTKGGTGTYYAEPAADKDRVKYHDTDDFPVENVSFEEAVAFIKKLNEKERLGGWRYSLPSEAQWEYSCRGGASSSEHPFHFNESTSSLSSEQANFDGNYPYGGAAKSTYLERTCKVRSYKPNRLGLYQMHGNVWEWCSDWYHKDFYGTNAARKAPRGPESGSNRVLRGGSWHDNGRGCRAAARHGHTPVYRSRLIGFRLALVPSR